MAREVGLIDGGPEVDLRGVGFSRVGFGGVPAVPAPTPNRPDADPERDDNEGVKAPNIAVRARDEPDRRTPDVSDDQVPKHVTAWSVGPWLPHPSRQLYSASFFPTCSTMKVNVTQEELEAFDRATIRGSIEGIATGLAISLPASFAAHRYVPAYRALPLHLKALGVVLIVGPTWAIQTERRGVEFDEQYNWWASIGVHMGVFNG